jgi:ligand-binding SRPBCC domain-containing protein
MAHVVVRTKVEAPLESCFDLARDIDEHQRSLRDTGEQAVAGRTSGHIDLGEQVTFRSRMFGLTWQLTSRVTEFDRPHRFVDEQVRGPFKSFRHEHLFELADRGTLMIDDWRHVAPFGPLGWLADRFFLERTIRGLLERRASELARHAAAATKP